VSRFTVEEIAKMTVDEFRSNRLCVPAVIRVDGQEIEICLCSDLATWNIYKKGRGEKAQVYTIDDLIDKMNRRDGGDDKEDARSMAYRVARAFNGRVIG
jgi:hypothetical protein